MDPRTKHLFTKRGIDPASDVVRERPYTEYRAGDAEVLYAVDPKYGDELRPGQVRWLEGMLAQRDGVIMSRHRGLSDSPEAWAQIRPHREKGDPGLLNRKFSHRHPWAYIHRHVRSVWPGVPGEGIAPDDPRAEHIVTTGAGGGDFRVAPHPRRDGVMVRQTNSRRWLDSHERNHPIGPADVPSELRADLALGEMHPHWWDWTAHLTTSEFAEQHDPELKAGERHVHEEYAKYLYPPSAKDEDGKPIPGSGKERSAGIDVHPLAEDLLDRGGRRVFYALEGILKNDAILAAGEPVFNTGSVTLWLPDELREFARKRLVRFDEVVIIPDSDWHSNPQVSRQANRVADLLLREGLDVRIAAPPADCPGGAVCTCKDRAARQDHKLGADDFLGQGGNVKQFISLKVDLDRAPEAIASKRRVALLLEHIFSHCDLHGSVYQSVDEMADAVGVDRRTIRSAIADAEGEGFVEYRVPDPEPGERTPVGTLTLRKDLRPSFEFVELGA
jgi:hypothetical protein